MVERRLPTVGHEDRARSGTADGKAGAAPGGPVREGAGPGLVTASPERIRDGWEHRFVAAGPRAEEMMALYGELGFEVVADPVPAESLTRGCTACFGGAGEEYRSIYTRRRADASPRSEAMEHTHPTRVLREEHQRILEVADALEAVLDGDPGGLDFDRLEKCIRFIRLFADACHHGKEEDLLFPALQEQGLPRDSGPIAVMLHEHRLGRRFASTMADNVEGARQGDGDAWSRLERAGRDYVGLIRGHILKEDNVLFGMADQLVAGPACARLCAAYDGTEGDTFGGCTKAELEALGREIVEDG